ncbi:KfrA protein [Burkholderia ubonensis]|uniref:KfrA protein n=1 Tax=Burkholderia ubonensis TaxID=101571 RepID=A0AAW3MWE0_9BURK|nr:DNA-binding protein [Burkholderia ubonensis]KVP98253.1 KfrA protein [Burkholderia ubonensis]KVZ92951.1 KfrA protein [Burkholderia ubonensis]
MTETTEFRPESGLQADVEALRERFPETRALYREVCGLLFFNYGVTPTANKLYSLVRKGSMGTPGEVLLTFWQELRERTRVKIEHPEMPEAIKQVAAEAVQGIWKAASAAATNELAELRDEAQRMAQAAEVQRQQTQTALDYARREIEVGQAKLDEANQALADLQASLQAERAAHAATEARLQETRRQVEERDRQLTAVRTQFSTELEHARQQVSQAETRATATERRVMLEFDQERTQRQKSERAAEEARTELTAARAELKEAAVQHADVAGRLRAELQGLAQRLTASDQERESRNAELAGVRRELADAVGRADRAEAEVAVTRRLVEDIRKAAGTDSAAGQVGAAPGDETAPSRA